MTAAALRRLGCESLPSVLPPGQGLAWAYAGRVAPAAAAGAHCGRSAAERLSPQAQAGPSAAQRSG